jgi:DNA modification methylase
VTEQLIIQGDARRLSEEAGLEPGSVGCFITSPPYHNLKRYSDGIDGEIGQGQTLEEYIESVRGVFAECFALATETGVLWLVADTLRRPNPGGLGELVPLPFLLADAARSAGWRLQEVIIWQKNKTLPYSGQGKLRNLIEYVLLLTKGTEFKHRPFRLAERHMPGSEWLAGWPERHHPLGKRPSNLWTIPIPTQGMWAHSERLHFCPFPQELVARCIELTTDKGDLVIDPFAGVGTVPGQAVAMGRQGLGIELNPSYIEMFEQRVLPAIQADWESRAEERALSRSDQEREARTILILRALKAGKEMSRLVERLARERPATYPAAAVESVVVVGPEDVAKYVRATEGKIEPLPVSLVVLGEFPAEQAEQLREDLEEALTAKPFTTFGLSLNLRLENREKFLQTAPTALYEFGQSRRGAFTTPIKAGKEAMPRLVSTLGLDLVVQGDRQSAIDRVRDEAERRLLQAELATSDGRRDLAGRLGVTEAEVYRLLLKHELDDGQLAFGVPVADF